MTKREEEAYILGGKAFAQRILRECISELGAAGTAERWRLERAAVVAKLREICADHGDNDWEDGDHLRDVLEKHLYAYLPDPEEEE